jgi:hypothetical protein
MSPSARGTFAMRARARGAKLPGAKETGPSVPESQTPQWKHRVEGEARARLEKRLRGIPVP